MRPPVTTLAPVEQVIEVLDEPTWVARRSAHERRVDAWVGPHLRRRSRGESHPVEDFLFSYYSQRPAALRRWHPGFGVGLRGQRGLAGLKGYVDRAGVVTVSRDYVESQRPLVSAVHRLLVATAGRPPQLGCLGIHEWAMVYRLDPSRRRHDALPLRLGRTATDEVVASHRLTCSHFDAFRFFTNDARPLNTLQPGRDDRPAFEQPGCLHAGMDLYKHSFRLSPMVCSDLVADCFELARDIRVLDMRASPYDLTGLGYHPVRIETAEGRQEYVEGQRGFASRGAPLRQRLVDECARLLDVGAAQLDSST
jgi:hypothetical protein